MKKFKFIIILMHLILCCSMLLMGSFKVNYTGGARPLALGGAFVGLADDVYAILYNLSLIHI